MPCLLGQNGRMPQALSTSQRLSHIALARQQVIEMGAALQVPLVEDWIPRSWQRCLQLGHTPQQNVSFDPISHNDVQHLQEQHHHLLYAAQTELDRLSQAIAGTRYFALLTDAQGTVIDTRGDIPADSPRARDIARIGVNLSEARVGTTAIGAALAEQRPIWLHRGEHFFNDNASYSCAGAPLFDTRGDCVGMIDITGVDVPERPELQHLAAQSARHIQNALLQHQQPALMLRLNWAGQPLGGDGDGWIGLDTEGGLIGANQVARQILQLSAHPHHASDIFAMAWTSLFDLPHTPHTVEAPLWSGLRVQLQRSVTPTSPQSATTVLAAPLKSIEGDLIRRAMQQARGNVAEAARSLGISRATLYRKISPQKKSAK